MKGSHPRLLGLDTETCSTEVGPTSMCILRRDSASKPRGGDLTEASRSALQAAYELPAL